MTKLQENIVEIARSAQYLIERHDIDIDDSKAFNTKIVAWAEEFEQQNSHVDYNVDLGRNYYLEIDKFAIAITMKEFYLA
tara:strand:- start:929 stop:1168 length:240 start_codon:yes stop_codon:yes gene_type:complete